MIDVLYPTPAGMSEVLKPDNSHWDPKLMTNQPAVVNTTMESYLTYHFSSWTLDNCQSCHYDATPLTASGVKSAPQVFSYLYRRATPSRAVGSGGACTPRH